MYQPLLYRLVSLSLCHVIAAAAVTFSLSMTSTELEQWLLQEIPQPEHVKNITKLRGMLINTSHS